MSRLVIGLVGGMGSYATLSFFKRILKAFPAQKEWERPRIIIDNRCTMPSRVRAVIYGEHREELIKDLADSVEKLMMSGCTKIFLLCNTAHIFLEDIYRIFPESNSTLINMLQLLSEEINKDIITKQETESIDRNAGGGGG